MNVFPYYLLRITVQMSVQKCVKECLDHFIVLTRLLSNLIVQVFKRVGHSGSDTGPSQHAQPLLHLDCPINSRTSRLAYSVSSPSVLGQRHLDLVATTR
jgi:hypothetical protein